MKDDQKLILPSFSKQKLQTFQYYKLSSPIHSDTFFPYNAYCRVIRLREHINFSRQAFSSLFVIYDFDYLKKFFVLLARYVMCQRYTALQIECQGTFSDTF